MHGQLVCSFLAQLITEWAGRQGSLRRLSCTYRRMNFPGQMLVCNGTVDRKYLKDSQHCVDCEVWTENEKGEKTVLGKATVALPKRG